jgi:hypothetical protein
VASRELELRDPCIPVDRGSDLAHLVVLLHRPERAAIHGVNRHAEDDPGVAQSFRFPARRRM